MSQRLPFSLLCILLGLITFQSTLNYLKTDVLAPATHVNGWFTWPRGQSHNQRVGTASWLLEQRPAYGATPHFGSAATVQPVALFLDNDNDILPTYRKRFTCRSKHSSPHKLNLHNYYVSTRYIVLITWFMSMSIYLLFWNFNCDLLYCIQDHFDLSTDFLGFRTAIASVYIPRDDESAMTYNAYCENCTYTITYICIWNEANWS